MRPDLRVIPTTDAVNLSNYASAWVAATSTATLFTGANLSATRHAKMRREKLSMTACR